MRKEREPEDGFGGILGCCGPPTRSRRRDLEQVREVLDGKLRQSVLEDEGQGLALAVVWREVGRVVGEVSLQWLSRRHRQDELVYAMLDHEWRSRRDHGV